MRESSVLSPLLLLCQLARARRGADTSYAGWIGTVGAAHEGVPHPTLEDAATRLAAIAGTSTCHIAQSKEGILVPGVVCLLSFSYDSPLKSFLNLGRIFGPARYLSLRLRIG